MKETALSKPSLGIDLAEALRAKLIANAAKYPVDKARGRNAKWDTL